MYFAHPAPKTILPDLPSLLAYLQNPGPDRDKFAVKSLTLCALIETIFSETGERFAYNSTINARAQKEFGLPYEDPHGSGTPLSTLVYNAQGYVRADHATQLGFEPFTQDLIDRAGREKAKIGFFDGTVANVRQVHGKFRATKPRARKYAYRPDPELAAKILGLSGVVSSSVEIIKGQ